MKSDNVLQHLSVHFYLILKKANFVEFLTNE